MEAASVSAPAGLSRTTGGARLLRLRSDDQLVALFRRGDDDAFRIIHDRYRARLLAYTRQMLGGSRSDAEDALQDVFVRAHHALRLDDRPVSLRAWLYRVAHNRCIDQMRRATPDRTNVVELFDVAGTTEDPVAACERREDLRRLVADLRRLPDQQRSALLMREMDGLTYRELADALEVSIPAVKSLLVRARLGLVEAEEARNTACRDIRSDLALAHGRGVRASGRARRHLRECDGCRAYRARLKGLQDGIAALSPPTSAWGAVAKALGLVGGAGSGGAAAAGGGAASGTIAIGGGAAAVTAGKVVAVVCCAAVVGGGAVGASRETHHTASVPHAAHARPPVVAAAETARRIGRVGSARVAATVGANRRHAHRAHPRAKPSGGSTVTIDDLPVGSYRLDDPAVAAPDADALAAADAGGKLAPAEDDTTAGADGASATGAGGGSSIVQTVTGTVVSPAASSSAPAAPAGAPPAATTAGATPTGTADDETGATPGTGGVSAPG